VPRMSQRTTSVAPALAGRRGILAGLACAFGVGVTAKARATTDPALLDITRYAYIPSATTPDVTIIDIETQRIVGNLHSGVVAQQAVVSRDAATLIATDGRSSFVSLVDVFAGTARTVVLAGPVERLTVSADGRLVAATHLAGGTIALIDLGDARVKAQITNLPPLRDVMFGEQDEVLYIAAEGLEGIGVVPVSTGQLLHEIPTFTPTHAGVGVLARTPDGRRVLAQPQGGGPISLLDPEHGKAIAELDGGLGTAGLFPSRTGNYLLVPDNTKAMLAVFQFAHLAAPVALPGADGVVGVYTAWLDSVAFMPNVARRSVLVYDLDKMRLANEIELVGTPVRGAVTPDSRTLYLPVLDPPQVRVIDGDTRRVTASLDLSSPPLMALIAGSAELCH
jgi:DNA-binding beta-propeller fold protein YncE